MEDLEIRKKAEALSYLGGQKAAVLSTHASDGTIDAAAVYFIIDEQLNFYFTTKVGTRKYQNMTTNPNVTLTIPNAETLQTIELKGKASLVTSPKEITDHTVSLINKNKFEGAPWAQPVAKLHAGQYVIMKITPTWLRYGIFLNEEPKGEYFTQLIG